MASHLALLTQRHGHEAIEQAAPRARQRLEADALGHHQLHAALQIYASDGHLELAKEHSKWARMYTSIAST